MGLREETGGGTRALDLASRLTPEDRSELVKFRHCDIFSGFISGLTVLVRVVWAVCVSITELLGGLAGKLVQAGLAPRRAALLRLAVGGVHEHVVVGTSAGPALWSGEAQVLTATVVFCTLVQTCKGSRHLSTSSPSRARAVLCTYRSDWTC